MWGKPALLARWRDDPPLPDMTASRRGASPTPVEMAMRSMIGFMGHCPPYAMVLVRGHALARNPIAGCGRTPQEYARLLDLQLFAR